MTARPWQRYAAWALLFIMAAVVAFDVARRPLRHTTMQTYREAATNWWAGTDLYSEDTNSGFFYFPQGAVIFSPFNIVPFWAGEIAWRLFTFGLFFYALTRLARFFLGSERVLSDKSFLILALLAVPSSLASLRNAQYDLPLAAIIVLIAAEVAAKRWNAAAAWACLGIALKPLALVPLLLFGALYWKNLLPRIAAGLVIVLLLPFLHWSPSYVLHEYARCAEALSFASKAEEPKFSDLSALLSLRLGYQPSHELKTAVRVVFAIVYLGLGWIGIRRLPSFQAAWLIGALSADYLMLFNPRTEACSYVFLGPFIASLAVYFTSRDGYKLLAWFLGFCALGLASDAIPKVGDLSFHLMTDRWFKPFIALIFFGILIWFIFRKRSRTEMINASQSV